MALTEESSWSLISMDMFYEAINIFSLPKYLFDF